MFRWVTAVSIFCALVGSQSVQAEMFEIAPPVVTPDGVVIDTLIFESYNAATKPGHTHPKEFIRLGKYRAGFGGIEDLTERASGKTFFYVGEFDYQLVRIHEQMESEGLSFELKRDQQIRVYKNRVEILTEGGVVLSKHTLTPYFELIQASGIPPSRCDQLVASAAETPSIAGWLSDAMALRRFSSSDLAEKSGVERSEIENILNGTHSNVGIEDLGKLGTALDTDLASIFTRLGK